MSQELTKEQIEPSLELQDARPGGRRAIRILLFTVLALLLTAYFYANRILADLVPQYLSQNFPGQVSFGAVEGSLLWGVVIRDIEVRPPGADKNAPTLCKVDETRMVYNLVKSLMLRDRFITVKLDHAQVSINLSKPLFDPFMLRDLKAALAAQNLTLDLSIQEGELEVVGLPYRSNGFRAEFTSQLSLSGRHTGQFTVSSRDERTAYRLEGDLDLEALQADAAVEMVTNQFLVKPLELGEWTYQTPLEGKGRLSARLLHEPVPPDAAWQIATLAQDRHLAYTFAGDLTALAGKLEHSKRGIRRVGISSRGRATIRGLEILEGRIPTESGEIVVTGVVPDWNPAAARFEVKLTAIPAAEVQSFVPFDLTGSVTGVVRGSTGNPTKLDLVVDSPHGKIFDFDSARIQAEFCDESVDVTEFEAWGEQGVANATAFFDRLNNRYHFLSKFRDFPHWTFAAFLDERHVFNGRFDGTLSGEGSLDPITYENWIYDFVVADTVIDRWPLSRAKIKGRYNLEDSIIETLEVHQKASLKQGRFRIEDINGKPWRMTGSVNDLDLSFINPDFQGQGSFKVVYGKTSRGLKLESAEGRLSSATLPGVGVVDRMIDVKVSPLSDQSLRLQVKDVAGSIDVEIPQSVMESEDAASSFMNSPLMGSFEITDLAKLTQSLGPAGAKMPQSGQLSGHFSAPLGLSRARDSLGLDLSSSRLEFSGGTLSADRSRVDVKQGNITLSPTVLRLDDSTVEIEGQVLADRRVALQMSGRHIPLGRQGTPFEAFPIKARLDGRMKVTGTLDLPVAAGDFKLSDIDHAGIRNLASGPTSELSGSFKYADGSLELGASRFTSGKLGMDLAGRVPVEWHLPGAPQVIDEPMLIRVQLPRTDARLMKLFAPGLVRDIRGVLAGDISLSGLPSRPRLRGEIDLDAKWIESDLVRGRVTNLKVNLVQTDQGTELRRLSGEALGGRFRGEGRLPVTDDVDPAQEELAMVFQLEDMKYDSDAIQVDGIEGRLALTGTVVLPQLKGRMTMAKAQLKDSSGGEPFGGVSTMREALADSPVGDLRVDVSLDVPGNLWVKSNFLNAEMKGEVNIKGPLASFKLGGQLEAERGSMYVQGKKLRLTQGVVKFDRQSRENFFEFTNLDNPGLKIPRDAPYLKFSSESEVDGVRVYVDVRGYGVKDGMTTSLRSLPPLEEGQLVALLATGQRSANSLSGRGVPDLLGFSLASQMQSAILDRQVESLVQRFFALDNFRLNSNLVKIGDGPSAASSVSLGKYLAPNVYVAADGNLNKEDPFFQRVELQLKLQKNTALLVERTLGGYGIVGGGGPFDRLSSTSPENRIGLVQSLRW